MSDEFHAPDRTWRQKFRDAFRGVKLGIHDQSSFYFHFLAAAAVLAAAAFLRLNLIAWAVLVLCISSVLAAEMFNTALEHLAKAVDRSHNPHIANSLDIGSAAVLMASLGAAAAGAILLGWRLLQLIGVV